MSTPDAGIIIGVALAVCGVLIPAAWYAGKLHQESEEEEDRAREERLVEDSEYQRKFDAFSDAMRSDASRTVRAP
jgi:hypothetical protein